MRLALIFEQKMAARQCFLKKWWASTRNSVHSSPSLWNLLNKNSLVTLFYFLHVRIIHINFYHTAPSALTALRKALRFFQMYLKSSFPMFLVTFLTSSPVERPSPDSPLSALLSDWLLIEIDCNSYPDSSCLVSPFRSLIFRLSALLVLTTSFLGCPPYSLSPSIIISLSSGWNYSE